MNMYHPTAAEQARKAKELKDKFFGKASVSNVANDALASARRTIEKQAARIAEMAATIDALQSMIISDARKEGLHKSPLSVVERVLAEKHQGVTFAHVVGRNKTAKCAAARRDCIIAVYEQFPAMHPSEIAKLFKRDRTTILSALGKKKRPDFKAAQNDTRLL